MTDDEIWNLVADHRRELAALGAGLSAQQWSAPSLCRGWTCGDVIAHVAWVASASIKSMIGDMMRARMRPHRGVADGARRIAAQGQESVCALLTASADSRTTAPGVPAMGYLADTIVHTQDVRRPLHIDHTLDPQITLLALRYYIANPLPVGARTRIRGIELRATDAEFRHGHGPGVAGTVEQLLMVVAGRMSVVAELIGPGKAPLAGRS
jgi:uncharacterized protein (TIGR03083 family)